MGRAKRELQEHEDRTALPMSPAPPVTTATLPDNSMAILLLPIIPL